MLSVYILNKCSCFYRMFINAFNNYEEQALVCQLEKLSVLKMDKESLTSAFIAIVVAIEQRSKASQKRSERAYKNNRPTKMNKVAKGTSLVHIKPIWNYVICLYLEQM
ncbi:hypothetical protein BY458DRAFT_489636 [Sporodiniella umbellata]|nr:hypothetical protein BY458DRAFT_489634 [Sporodiniella umbellata]KAI9272489.1 hypothetical protein BY458DRAFT_489635 [Sporodiniella umbellata]KAI9272490.1 hypothetical protein BY458DRAFT_489636 [Sporodiniella umbellata]